MQSLDWDNVRYFLEVVRAGSVSQAAQQMAVNQTTVSRRIGILEAQLGNKVFDRSVKGWMITTVGERLIESAEHMAEEAHSIERFVMAESQELRGRLRLTVGDICTQQLVMPAIESFIKKYPEVDLEIIATREDLNLSAREADIALRATDNPPENLVGQRIATLAFAVYANKKMYRQRWKKNDCQGASCITWIGDSHTRPPWIEKSFLATPRVYRTSELGVMLQMVRQGLGIAQMPCALCEPDPTLIRIPAKYTEPGWGLWLLSHVDLRTTARIRIFKNFLLDELKQQTVLLEGH
jgi:DNA-binding transcriptional LysR family regulator